MGQHTTRERLRRATGAVVGGALGLCVLAPAAQAAPPTREPFELPTEPFVITDTKGDDPCGFPVELLLTKNQEVETTFVRRDGSTRVHITGALVARLTNTETGRTITRNISGPLVKVPAADGTAAETGLGRALWAFDPEVAPGLPRLAVLSGRSQYTSGTFAWSSFRGHAEDLCAALSG